MKNTLIIFFVSLLILSSCALNNQQKQHQRSDQSIDTMYCNIITVWVRNDIESNVNDSREFYVYCVKPTDSTICTESAIATFKKTNKYINQKIEEFNPKGHCIFEYYIN